MKIRTDYVSNSSSSSFIVITKTGTDITNEIKETIARYSEWGSYKIPNEHGKHQFGWEWEDTNDFFGKLNFVGIQLISLELIAAKNKGSYYKGNPADDFEKYFDMLVKVCKEKFGFNVMLNDDVIRGHIYKDNGKYNTYVSLDYDYYIDHQSCVTENQCMDMFKSEDALYDFLRYSESYVKGGNDNV